MKKLIYILLGLCFPFLQGCMDDKGNYTYDFDNVPTIELDSLMLAEAQQSIYYIPWNVGDNIKVPLEINYQFKDRLQYFWLVTDYPYEAQSVGNAKVYPPADTICRTLSLDYTVSLDAGKTYSLDLVIKDSVTNLSKRYQFLGYFKVPEAGYIGGIYCLQQKDGRLDIDIFGTPASLIFSYNSSNNFHVNDYWSKVHPDHPLKGNTGSIYSSDTGEWFYVFTEDEGMRCDKANLVVMDTWENMFHNAPKYAPEAFICLNGCDFLINNGKLHCLYLNKGDRKFQTYAGGSYDLAPFLVSNTVPSRPKTGIITPYQIVFDKEQNGFRPFYNLSSSLDSFLPSKETAVFDVNHLDGEVLYAGTANSSETIALMKRTDGSYWLDIACFYNVVDDGNMARRSVSLEGCQKIDQATCYTTGTYGPVLFYGAGNTIYSFSYTTGQKEALELWTGDAGDNITCMTIMPAGGFPTGGCILFTSVWNEEKKEGKVVEIEFDTTTGRINNFWGPMFGGQPTPQVYEGFGKIVSMTIPLIV